MVDGAAACGVDRRPQRCLWTTLGNSSDVGGRILARVVGGCDPLPGYCCCDPLAAMALRLGGAVRLREL